MAFKESPTMAAAAAAGPYRTSLCAAGEIFALGRGSLAWPFEALSRGHQAVWRDGDAIAHEPTAARALMSPEHGHGPAM